MSTIKIKVPGGGKPRKSSQPESSTSRKKRRIADDDEDNYALESSERASPSETLGVEQLFDNDAINNAADVDVVGDPENDDDRQHRSVSPDPSRKKGSQRDPGDALPRKRNKKKANIVYSDEEDNEDDYDDYRERSVKEDRDDDFILDSPPRKPAKKGASGAKGKGRGAKDRGGSAGEILVKDERKVAVSQTIVSETVSVKSVAGTKRRRDTVTEVATTEDAIDAEPTIVASSSSASLTQQSQSQEELPPPSKIKKLPTIKKNKALAAASTAPSSGTSTPGPAASIAPAKSGSSASAPGAPNAPGLPIHVSLPRKPAGALSHTTADVDLSRPDIYASLFSKSAGSGSTTPRAGINPRVKEEERRKELLKMRDEARASRLADLEKSTFDLLSGQDKVARFEEKLRARNSPALYPNHLASAIKQIAMSRKALS